MVRVRYAPSPTGSLHIGGARTALFNYLFAHRQGGAFILRIEDTDRARFLPDAEATILNGLRSLGVTWDEGPDIGGAYGPYRQFERLPLYAAKAEELVAAGKAYRCYCTPEELDADRRALAAQKLPPRYLGRCRTLTSEDWAARGEARYVLRLRVPTTGATVVEDRIRGTVVFQNDILDDFIIAKADGTPTYNFAVAVDDHAMGITHVIRGEEHLSNTPKQILVDQALGYEQPEWVHVPMILAPDHSKLSKRHGATAVEEYYAQGIIPEALVNYLLLLGWSDPEERELLTVEEAAALFDLGRVQHTAAIYDQKKLEWLSGQYMRTLPAERVVALVTPFLLERGVDWSRGPSLNAAVTLYRERARTLIELAEGIESLYRAPAAYDAKGLAKHASDPEVGGRLRRLVERLTVVAPWDHDAIAECFTTQAEAEGVNRAALIHPTRLAVTGRTVGPGLFELLETLGPEETRHRLTAAVERWPAEV